MSGIILLAKLFHRVNLSNERYPIGFKIREVLQMIDQRIFDELVQSIKIEPHEIQHDFMKSIVCLDKITYITIDLLKIFTEESLSITDEEVKQVVNPTKLHMFIPEVQMNRTVSPSSTADTNSLIEEEKLRDKLQEKLTIRIKEEQKSRKSQKIEKIERTEKTEKVRRRQSSRSRSPAKSHSRSRSPKRSRSRSRSRSQRRHRQLRLKPAVPYKVRHSSRDIPSTEHPDKDIHNYWISKCKAYNLELYRAQMKFRFHTDDAEYFIPNKIITAINPDDLRQSCFSYWLGCCTKTTRECDYVHKLTSQHLPQGARMFMTDRFISVFSSTFRGVISLIDRKYYQIYTAYMDLNEESNEIIITFGVPIARKYNAYKIPLYLYERYVSFAVNVLSECITQEQLIPNNKYRLTDNTQRISPWCTHTSSDIVEIEKLYNTMIEKLYHHMLEKKD